MTEAEKQALKDINDLRDSLVPRTRRYGSAFFGAMLVVCGLAVAPLSIVFGITPWFTKPDCILCEGPPPEKPDPDWATLLEHAEDRYDTQQQLRRIVGSAPVATQDDALALHAWLEAREAERKADKNDPDAHTIALYEIRSAMLYAASGIGLLALYALVLAWYQARVLNRHWSWATRALQRSPSGETVPWVAASVLWIEIVMMPLWSYAITRQGVLTHIEAVILYLLHFVPLSLLVLSNNRHPKGDATSSVSSIHRNAAPFFALLSGSLAALAGPLLVLHVVAPCPSCGEIFNQYLSTEGLLDPIMWSGWLLSMLLWVTAMTLAGTHSYGASYPRLAWVDSAIYKIDTLNLPKPEDGAKKQWEVWCAASKAHPSHDTFRIVAISPTITATEAAKAIRDQARALSILFVIALVALSLALDVYEITLEASDDVIQAVRGTTLAWLIALGTAMSITVATVYLFPMTQLSPYVSVEAMEKPEAKPAATPKTTITETRYTRWHRVSRTTEVPPARKTPTPIPPKAEARLTRAFGMNLTKLQNVLSGAGKAGGFHEVLGDGPQAKITQILALLAPAVTSGLINILK